ncbi:MBL fold metallo-hydrolase [uncultured Algibacter sp.]|uniref:MBL fold metallo-hydrolase n=1 Tax=uncultured Algibacter sp. TaxID=298659 RepID=UPI00262BD820|nr:MBL fold metallo-hydrolase [uncultured Algibacter sp.]
MKLYKSISTFLIFGFILSACSQNKEVTIKTHKLSENIYMLEGQGGNIGISIGEDGVLMIDSQFAKLTSKILEAIKNLSDKPIKFLANTHHHGDHTGGNENISKLDVNIIAHDNIYRRVKNNKRQTDESLPTITFNNKLSLYINGEQVIAMHFDNAHTDGDSMLYFTKSNVLHTGDIFFHNRYPYIDLNSGGSVTGYIEAVKGAMILIDENTKIIPGHGNLSNKKEYETFLKMLINLKSNVLAEIKNGKTEEEVTSNTSLTKTYDDLGYSWGFITSEKIRKTLYKSLKK